MSIIAFLHFAAIATIIVIMSKNIDMINISQVKDYLITVCVAIFILDISVVVFTMISSYRYRNKLDKKNERLLTLYRQKNKQLIINNNRLSQEIKESLSLQNDLRLQISLNKTYEEELRTNNEELHSVSDELKESYEILEAAKLKAEESDRIKSSFLANISHEIRTPMNGIIGFASLLNNPNLDESRRKQYSDVLVSSTKRFLDVINDIINYSRIQAGELKPVYETFDLHFFLNNIFMQNTLLLKQMKKDIELKFNCDFSKKCFIGGSENFLRQILSNLIENAMKFTEQGSVTVNYRVRNNRLFFEVIDTGIGVPVEKRDVIFDSFMQVESILARRYGGAGLGLSIIKGLVNLLGGNIGLESNIGVGSNFYFDVPLMPAVESEKDIYLRIDKQLTIAPVTQKILIIECDNIGSLFLKELFSGYGIDSYCAYCREEALQILSDHADDIFLVITDIIHPTLEGINIALDLLAVKPGLRFIFETTCDLTPDELLQVNKITTEIIEKPVSVTKLFQSLSRFVLVKNTVWQK